MKYKILGVHSGAFEVSEVLGYDNASFYVWSSIFRNSMIISSPIM